MLTYNFTPTQLRRAAGVVTEIDEASFGLAQNWIPFDALRRQRDELMDFPEVNEQIAYNDVLDLPPHTAALVAGLGTIGLQNGLTPKQVIIVDQEPDAPGRGHFDVRVEKSLSVPLYRSWVAILRPGRDDEGIPEMNEAGEFSLAHAHKLWVPAGTLLGFAGTLMKTKAAYHQVGNPSPTTRRKSIAIAFQ